MGNASLIRVTRTESYTTVLLSGNKAYIVTFDQMKFFISNVKRLALQLNVRDLRFARERRRSRGCSRSLGL